MGIRWKDGYSASIDLNLIIDGERISVAQVGPEYFILEFPRHLEPGFADLEICIDGCRNTYRIVLSEDNSPDNPIVKFHDHAQTVIRKLNQIDSTNEKQHLLPLPD